MAGVDLGFVEKAEKWKLLSHFFPSKVGGKPAWLYLKNLPKIDELTCPDCQKPCIFLLQIYCPLGDKANCFHRTLFIFTCKTSSCSGSNKFHVLRSQLPRINEFYSDQPPNEDEYDGDSDYPSASKFQNLCRVCGCAGNKNCSRCHETTYCSREHQVLDWKAGHKSSCGTAQDSRKDSGKSILFSEWELVIESEELDNVVEKSEKDRIAEYEAYMKKLGQDDVEVKSSDKDLEDMAKSEGKEDKVFQNFRDRISADPEQVLRYEIGGSPLFVAEENRPVTSSIPPCKCGEPRRFEFQVMPQLLNYLSVDSVDKQSLDWGTLLVYTCSVSCDPPPDQPYMHEFIWKQDFSNVDSAK